MLSSANCAVPENWQTFKGDNSRNAVFEERLPDDLDLVWRHRLPATITASPTVAGDTLLVATDNGVIYAFSLANRVLLWAFDSGGAIRSTPAVAEEKVYFLSQSGTFYALDLSNGAVHWSFDTQGESSFSAYNYLGIENGDLVEDPWDLLQSSPLVAENTVVFGSSDRHVYALDSESGEMKWTFRTGGRVHSSPALFGNSIIIGSWDSAVYSLQLEGGALDWKFETQAEQKYSVWRGIQSSPTVSGDEVFIGSRDGFKYALEAYSGDEIWRYDMSRSWVVPTASVDDERVYLGTSDTGLLLALDRMTGEEAWRFSTGAWTYSSPLVFADAVLTATMTGKIIAVSKETGGNLWESRHGALASDVYQILGEDERLRSDMGNGTWQDGLYGMMARVMASGGFMSSPAWVDDQLIIFSTAGEILVWE